MILITENSCNLAENWTLKSTQNKWKLRHVEREVFEICVQICFATNNVILVTEFKIYFFDLRINASS